MMRPRNKRVYTQDDATRNRNIAVRGALAIRDVGQIRNGQHPERNLIRQRAILLAAAADLVEWNRLLDDIRKMLLAVMCAETPNANLPWSQDEDAALVQWRAAGTPLHEIAASLGRTPAACATRISTLVGIPRSTVVDGYLSGTLEGIPVSGLFHGEIKR